AAYERPGRGGISALDRVWVREAARLVPELDDGAPAASRAPEAHARFLEGVVRAIAACAQRGVVILDDLHWFDGPSLELCQHLVRRAAALELKIVATARPFELEERDDAKRFVGALEREGLLQRLALEPLAEEHIVEMIRAMSGRQGALGFSRRL